MGKQSRQHRERREAKRDLTAPTSQPPGSPGQVEPPPWWRRRLTLAGAGAAIIAAGAITQLDTRRSKADYPDVQTVRVTTTTTARLKRGVTEREPNNEPAKATPMSRRPLPATQAPPWARGVNQYQASGRLASADDIDCHLMPLEVPPSGAVLRARLTGKEAGAFSIMVWSERKPLTMFTGRPGAALVIPALGARAWVSDYRLCVHATKAKRNARYQLSVQTLAPSGAIEFEPNGVKGMASALPRAVTVAGFLRRQDTDWFRISAGRGTMLQATYTPAPGVTVEIALLDAAGAPLAKTTASAAPAQLRAKRAMFVTVRAISGSNVHEPYQLTVSAPIGNQAQKP